MSINKHPLDLINERLENGYYAKMPPYSYSKDVATVCYLLGYCSEVEYQVVKAKYDMFNWKSCTDLGPSRKYNNIVY